MEEGTKPTKMYACGKIVKKKHCFPRTGRHLHSDRVSSPRSRGKTRS